jgi:hypothetical protein
MLPEKPRPEVIYFFQNPFLNLKKRKPVFSRFLRPDMETLTADHFSARLDHLRARFYVSLVGFQFPATGSRSSVRAGAQGASTDSPGPSFSARSSQATGPRRGFSFPARCRRAALLRFPALSRVGARPVFCSAFGFVLRSERQSGSVACSFIRFLWLGAQLNLCSSSILRLWIRFSCSSFSALLNLSRSHYVWIVVDGSYLCSLAARSKGF